MALKKTFENKDGGTSNGYYRVTRSFTPNTKKIKTSPTTLEATFNVEAV